MVNTIVDQTLQADLIILNVPLKSSRTGELYEIPESLGAPDKKLFINVVEKDLGPITKLAPTIKYLRDNGYPENTRIVYCDDDVLYPRSMLESFSKTASDSVWAASAFCFVDSELAEARDHNSIADVAEGYGGVCVSLGMFGDDFFDYVDELINISDTLKYYDDLVLSNYFAKRGIQIRVNAKDYCFEFLYSSVEDSKKMKRISEDIDYDPELAKRIHLSFALSHEDKNALGNINGSDDAKLVCLETLQNEKLSYL